jgi:hypothetical protein
MKTLAVEVETAIFIIKSYEQEPIRYQMSIVIYALYYL